MKKRLRQKGFRPPVNHLFCIALSVAAIIVIATVAAGGMYFVELFNQDLPLATDDRGRAVIVDDLRQVTLHRDEVTVAVYVVHMDDVENVLDAARQRCDEDGEPTHATVRRIHRIWPHSWDRQDMRTLFGENYASVFDWAELVSVPRLCGDSDQSP
ncbi:MAG: hypothetical protein U9Q03_03640 [Patescibacteria group bacterium]|nr:hypothetical protein [Patescibacteria group bacterium]